MFTSNRWDFLLRQLALQDELQFFCEHFHNLQSLTYYLFRFQTPEIDSITQQLCCGLGFFIVIVIII